MEAKLKRAYQEGQAARAAGQDPLAAELAASTHRLQENGPPAQHPVPNQAAPEPAATASQQQQAAAAAAAAGVTGVLSSVTTEQELSVAQADANMAALLQEEAG